MKTVSEVQQIRIQSSLVPASITHNYVASGLPGSQIRTIFDPDHSHKVQLVWVSLPKLRKILGPDHSLIFFQGLILIEGLVLTNWAQIKSH